ncbi:glycoside hydrolase family 18 protein [Microbulbifer sp. SAOS-129_SWC]|uniref:glycoside hydrolase family 18 protein n=1 Tax=Microbulbifer sp. SAOS-129_SWC TaxID=3145235 RepID=UPI003216E711
MSKGIYWLAALWIGLSACAVQAAQSGAAARDSAPAQELAVIGYYTGDGRDLARYDFDRLTHVIFSFVHLDGNRVAFDSAEAIAAYRRLVALKKSHPRLKVMFSLGGWGGCETCSPVFANAENRRAFAQSVLKTLQQYGGDGIDLDWEYPSIAGYPGHAYSAADRAHFTALVRELRATLGDDTLLTFAAGGFDEYLHKAVDWRALAPLVSYINLMSYDLVNGFSTVTGHHSPLYSTARQKDSVDNGVRFLLGRGVPARKIVIGAAFYSRVWKQVAPQRDGRYEPGVHVAGLPYREILHSYDAAHGYKLLWDDRAKAPFAYNADKHLYATFDNRRSVTLKTRYAREEGLGGIMFWQLPGDSDSEGLLEAIDAEKRAGKARAGHGVAAEDGARGAG